MSINKKTWAVIFIVVAFVLYLVWPTHTVITINGLSISVTIADSPEERARGLSGKKSLEANKGMLFVFPEAGIHAFWMKDMNFAIDIIWLDENKHVIGIERNVAPDSYPRTFSPPIPVRYVLETNPGTINF